MIMDQEVGGDGCRNQAGDGQEVWQVVDILARRQVRQGRLDFLPDSLGAFFGIFKAALERLFFLDLKSRY